MDLDEYSRLKNKVENLRQRKSRAEGALEQAELRLRVEAGVGTVEEAERKLASLQRKSEKMKKRFEEMLAEFKGRWSEKLED